MSVRIFVVAIGIGVFVGGVAYLLLPRHPPVRVVALRPEPAPRREPIEPTPVAPDTAAAPIPPNAVAPRAARKAAGTPVPTPASETVAELGTLRITTDVGGASVFIDRQFIGTAPVTAQNVRPGTHQLNVTAEGHDGIARSIDVEPGPRDLSIRFKEVRLNATLAVVHKHRIGSCTGRLVATPQGLRYESNDKDDGFNVPLNALESFAVDYQDKNLKVKVRKGKQYNFTDPDGDADRLFVFQRDVDKVRQRLAKGDTPATD
ncbi:MAG TPA: PEGA domain-containing protein [Vicinamibacterales bacterium]|nr:PEGA domain-containing protein [Vicinamibacterales bacterium]